MVAVCQAADRAGVGEVRMARQVFYDGAHDALHALADQAAERDRAVAASLLEAKERVEAGFDAPTVTLATELRELAANARQAARTLRDPVVARCSSGGRTP